MATTSTVLALEWNKAATRLLPLRLLYVLLLLILFLQLILQLLDSIAIERALGDLAVLQTASIETWPVVVVAMADDLTTTNDDCAMTVV